MPSTTYRQIEDSIADWQSKLDKAVTDLTVLERDPQIVNATADWRWKFEGAVTALTLLEQNVRDIAFDLRTIRRSKSQRRTVWPEDIADDGQSDGRDDHAAESAEA